MVIHTTNGAYEVRETDSRYRRLPAAAGTLPGAWYSFDRMGPVSPGEPMVFFLGQAERGRALQYGVVRTSPVTQVRADSGGTP